MTIKNYLKIIFLLIIFGAFTSCSKNNDRSKFGLNGKVKSYLEMHYEAEMKFGEWNKEDIKYDGHHKVLFNKDGYYQWIEYLDDDNELTGKLIPTREKGKLIEESYYDKDGKLNSKTIITHDSNNELKFVAYNEDGEKTSQGKSFFENNRVIRQEYQTFENDKIENEYTVTFEYDKDWNLISQKQTNKKGKLTYFRKYEYLSFDKNDNWTKRLVYDSEQGEEPDEIVIRKYEYY